MISHTHTPVMPTPLISPAENMDSQNSSKSQENEGDQQPSELPIFSEKDKSQETSDHVPPLVCETIRLQIFWLTIAALSLVVICLEM